MNLIAQSIFLFFIGSADSKSATGVCLIIAGAWVLMGFFYVGLKTLQKTYRMRMVTCLIRPEQLGEVITALKLQNLAMGMTVTDVRGFGRQRGDKGKDSVEEETIRFLPKLKLEVLVKDWDVNRAMEVISKAARTGGIGDGKIIVLEVSSVMRIRTGEKGVQAL